ncbi:hypothetical protein F2Q69_00063689 [Brassica cretica]|uniref:Malectin-like domain-containing protein n=1 Tax=Brassica cretica TaxID=69181 RepID=A0A8S9RBA6_BRACR|nr:hypothetical protein F2Q69_00063689 [Brassica cretica]
MGFSFSDVVLDHHSPADEALRAQQMWRKFRYPEDVHDRLWSPFFVPEWRLLRRSLSINTSDNEYDIPEDILVTAVTPANVEFNISGGQNVSYGPISPEESEVYNLFNTSPAKEGLAICK